MRVGLMASGGSGFNAQPQPLLVSRIAAEEFKSATGPMPSLPQLKSALLVFGAQDQVAGKPHTPCLLCASPAAEVPVYQRRALFLRKVRVGPSHVKSAVNLPASIGWPNTCVAVSLAGRLQLRLCSVVFDAATGLNPERDLKRQTLLELVDFSNHTRCVASPRHSEVSNAPACARPDAPLAGCWCGAA